MNVHIAILLILNFSKLNQKLLLCHIYIYIYIYIYHIHSQYTTLGRSLNDY